MSAAEPGGHGLERRLGRLDQIVTRLEGEKLELAEALALFEEGIRELREAQHLIEQAELHIERLVEEPDGSLSREPIGQDGA